MRAILVIPGGMLTWPERVLATGGELTRVESTVFNGGLLAQLTLGLVVVLALAVGLSWLLRRYALPRDGLIRVVGGLPLGARERLLLIEVDEVRLLIGVTAQHMQTLHVFNPPAAPPFSLYPDPPHEPPSS
ncbi:MAG: flagellar biosynthetic protein FliO [Candidatus Competibacteraceae bacterium]